MGLDSIWDDRGEYLVKESKGFDARSTGCSCCSHKLNTEKDVRKEAIESLSYILRATDYFGWDIQELKNQAREQVEIQNDAAKKKELENATDKRTD